MLDRRRFSVATLAIAATPFILASAVKASRRAVADKTFFQWSKLGERVHFAEGGGGNVLYIPGDGESILIDCKNAGLGDTLKREAEALGPAIATTINTHHHGDHTGGNYAFSDSTELVAYKTAKPRIAAQMERYTNGLRSTVQATDTVARIGGDEFVIVQQSVTSPAVAEDLARRVLQELERPFDIDGTHVTIGASIGIAIAPFHANDEIGRASCRERV